uniref:Uncharacterized protein n=1 Tax=Cacopsylla melanoneura TaxID=428564 RepID=A0A8D8SKJ1_9HEMI
MGHGMVSSFSFVLTYNTMRPISLPSPYPLAPFHPRPSFSSLHLYLFHPTPLPFVPLPLFFSFFSSLSSILLSLPVLISPIVTYYLYLPTRTYNGIPIIMLYQAIAHLS